MAQAPVLDRQAIMAQLCERVANGELVKVVAKDLGVNPATVWKWAQDNEELGKLYARAREDQAHAIAQEALEIADEPAPTSEAVQRNRLRVDTRKWLASKIAPRSYGERVDVTSDGEKVKAALLVVPSEIEP